MTGNFLSKFPSYSLKKKVKCIQFTSQNNLRSYKNMMLSFTVLYKFLFCRFCLFFFFLLPEIVLFIVFSLNLSSIWQTFYNSIAKRDVISQFYKLLTKKLSILPTCKQTSKGTSMHRCMNTHIHRFVVINWVYVWCVVDWPCLFNPNPIHPWILINEFFSFLVPSFDEPCGDFT